MTTPNPLGIPFSSSPQNQQHNQGPSAAGMDLASSFVGVGALSSSPWAKQIVADDLAACSDDDEYEEQREIYKDGDEDTAFQEERGEGAGRRRASTRGSIRAEENTPLLAHLAQNKFHDTASSLQTHSDASGRWTDTTAATARPSIDKVPDEAYLQDQTTWQKEAKTLAGYAGPLIVTFLLQYSVNIASIFAVGHIGKVELGAVSLGTMTASITCYAFIQGLATALDTLCAQAYGSEHKHLVGLQMQRMLYFLYLLVTPIAVVWIFFSDQILNAMLPDPRTAELAALYLRVVAAGLPGYVALEGAKRFVQAQGLFHAATYALLIAAPFNMFVNWLFVWRFEWGFVGAPIAVAVTQNLYPVLLFAYVYFVDGRQCWGGFSRRAFTNWGPMIKLALPGMIMVVAEWLAFEVLTLASSRISTTHLAAQSILLTVCSTTFQIPFPLSIAASTRIARLIGSSPNLRGGVKNAQTAARVGFCAACGIVVMNVMIIFFFRFRLPRLFTEDNDVIALAASILPVVAGMQIFDGLAAMAHGLLRGLGRQRIGGWINLIAYYGIALPISFGLAFGLGWGLMGLWTGVTLGLAIVAGLEYWYVACVADWEASVTEAVGRNGAD